MELYPGIVLRGLAQEAGKSGMHKNYTPENKRDVLDRFAILLNGGNKSTQLTDIKKAKNLWEIYKSEIRNDEN